MTDKEKEALEDARQLLADICNFKVNAEDEAEKWLRAYGWPEPPKDESPLIQKKYH